MGIREQVSEFYGQTVARTGDLVYTACCTSDYDPALLDHLTAEVLDKRYGCESPLPDVLDGATVVDLGSGAGADCFIASRLVGEKGAVIGVDMTPALLEVARRNIAPITARLGYARPNVEFREGWIESLPLADATADVVISNCVINLSPEKEQVFREAWRVLRPGGELFISDIVADRRLAADPGHDPRLYAECLTGAAYLGDLRRMVARAGFADPRIVTSRRLDEVIDGASFDSIVLRAFKLELEDEGEDYGQVAVYDGGIARRGEGFRLDQDHRFPTGEPVRVSRNTADMLALSRYGRHFEVSEPGAHRGPFGAVAPVEAGAPVSRCC